MNSVAIFVRKTARHYMADGGGLRVTRTASAETAARALARVLGRWWQSEPRRIVGVTSGQSTWIFRADFGVEEVTP